MTAHVPLTPGVPLCSRSDLMKEPPRYFASDNAAPIHPQVLAAIERANYGHAVAYGNDDWTARATGKLQSQFGADIEVAFVFGGTGANVVGLATLLGRHEAIVCADTAHLWRDECAAPERSLGSKLVPLPTTDGKLRPTQIEPLLGDRGMVHRAQPRVVSITQATELGTVYTRAELVALGGFCRENGLLLHIDGARLANAAAYLGASLAEITAGCGADVLSFGGTKNGLLLGEAVIVFGEARGRGLPWLQKQSGQLPSKTRYVAAQFDALLTDDLWLHNARRANETAARLAGAIGALEDVEIVQPVESNAVFLRVPERYVSPLRDRYRIPVWAHDGPVVRIMTSFDTTDEDVDGLAAALAGGLA
jgi:threonine aldolase